MAKNKLEARRHGLEVLFRTLFWVQLVVFIMAVVIKILYKTGHCKIDLYSTSALIIAAVIIVFYYIATVLAKKGNIAAPIIGIFVGIVYVFVLSGVVEIIIGTLLLVDSILFIVYASKK